MQKQKQANRQTNAHDEAVETQDLPVGVERTEAQEELLEASDGLLDEIDEALNGLEQDFAQTYVQEGGE